MKGKKELINRGSATAKAGFKNEAFVIEEFNSWSNSLMAQQWLVAMGYNIKEIENVKAVKVGRSYKSDVQVEIKTKIKLKYLLDIQNIQVKLVSNPKGFNQVDKRWLNKYRSMWDMDDNVYQLLQYFTGETRPFIKAPKDSRRMFANEFSIEQQKTIINFFANNKALIVSDIFKGRGYFSAEWMLVIQKSNNCNTQWSIEPMNKVLKYFGNGSVSITPRGSLKIGHITIQRKGGDNGRKTANMLQFKINPAKLIGSDPIAGGI